MSLAANFANADLQEVVDKLTTDEAISLISGVGLWGTAAVPRLGIPSIKVSDGSNGVRGNIFFNGTPANCIPCATALGATWDVDMIREVTANLLAPETKQHAASVLLAPTCNIQRSPLGGRSFECFAEDPYLSGMMASAFINGLQSGGVAACIKHFVANDQEHEKYGSDSIISERALREIYLYPFMLAQKYAEPMCYMTAYNRLNGVHCSENPALLNDILRGEWASNAMIMSDWFGTYGLSESINAGMDLEMPGLNSWRSPEKVHRTIQSKKVTVKTIKERAHKVLELVQKLCKTNAEIIDGDGKERYTKNDADSALMRKVAAQSIVLLKNENHTLPLNAATFKKIAVIGPNAKAAIASGGGSAALKNAYVVSPFDGIAEALKGHDVEITYHEGCAGYKSLPTLERELVTESGEKGWVNEFYAHDSTDQPEKEPLNCTTVVGTTGVFSDTTVPGLTPRFTVKMRGKLLPRERNTPFKFGLTVAGRGKLFVDGELVIDNWTVQQRGTAFFGSGTVEETGLFELQAGKSHDILVEFVNVHGPTKDDPSEKLVSPAGMYTLGGAEDLQPQKAVEEAVAIAKDADVVVLVVGLNGDWETEGHDRANLDLPGLTDELVNKVFQANPKTIVVNQSGSAVVMPWADKVPAVIQSWFGGNENGNAIADVLFGAVNPSGKMSMTFPKRLEDIPSFGHYGNQNGRVRYAEDLYVGYKGYENRSIAPLWPFGFGLSYTSFKYENLSISEPTSYPDFSITLKVDITNTGSVTGSEVVQAYVSLPSDGNVTHPQSQLRAFQKAKDLAPGKTQTIALVLDKLAVSYWDDVVHKWRAVKGVYTIRLGGSSAKFECETTFVLEKDFEWSGL